MSILEQLQSLIAALPNAPLRRCSVWISPVMRDGDLAIIDTTQLNAALDIYRGRDQWPDNMLLVAMNSQTLSTLRKMLNDSDRAFMALDINHGLLAEWIIDSQCEKDPALNAKLRWRAVR